MLRRLLLRVLDSLPRRRGAFLAALAVALVGLAASAILLPLDVEILSRSADWRAVSEGIERSGRGGSWVAARRAVVHFHDLDRAATRLEIEVRGRGQAPATRLAVRTGEAPPDDVPLRDEPTTLSIPVPEGAAQVEVRLEVLAEGAERSFLVQRIALSRRLTGRHVAIRLLPSIAGVVCLVALWRRGPGGAMAWSAVAVLAVLGIALALVDPTAALALRPLTRDRLRLLGLALLWALALFESSRKGSAAAALVGTVGALYLPALRFGFVNEDFLFARPWSGPDLLDALTGTWNPTSSVVGYYRPLMTLVFAADYRIWGTLLAGYHLVNLALVAANGALALWLLRLLGLGPTGSLAGALAWVGHPLTASTAAWANQRTDSVMALFYLATLIVLLRPAYGRGSLALASLLGALALAAKEMAVTLPATAWLVCRAGPDPTQSRRRWPAMLALGACVLAYVALWASLFPDKVLGRAQAAAGWAGFDPHRAGDWLRLVPGLLEPVFMPSGHEHWMKTSLREWPFLDLAAGVLAAPAAVLLVARWGGRGPALRVALLGLVWPFVTVLPILGLKGPDLYRLGFLVALGFALVWGALVAVIETRSRAGAAAAAAVLALTLCPVTLAGVAAWGARGFYYEMITQGTLENAEWQRNVTPEMRLLFLEQVDRDRHAARWVEGRRRR